MGVERCRVRNYATGVNMCMGGVVSSIDACAEKTKEETQTHFQSSSGAGHISISENFKDSRGAMCTRRGWEGVGRKMKRRWRSGRAGGEVRRGGNKRKS